MQEHTQKKTQTEINRDKREKKTHTHRLNKQTHIKKNTFKLLLLREKKKTKFPFLDFFRPFIRLHDAIHGASHLSHKNTSFAGFSV